MAPSNLIAALEELAKKRDEITSAIVTLASLVGVDPAAYLGTPVAVSVTNVVNAAPPAQPLSERLKEAAQRMRQPEKPPGPQRPASQKTKATKRANKVSQAAVENRDAIVAALKASRSPMKPAALSDALGWHIQKMRKNLQPLLDTGTVKAEGKTSGRAFSLA